MKHTHHTTTNPSTKTCSTQIPGIVGLRVVLFLCGWLGVKVRGPLAGDLSLLPTRGFCSAEACLYLLSYLIVLNVVFNWKNVSNFIPSLFLL